MFGMSGTEIAIILVLALLLLGPSRLPQLARTVGKGVRDFRRATSDIRSSVETEFYRMDEPLQPGRPAVTPAKPEGAPVPSTPAALAADTGTAGPGATSTAAAADTGAVGPGATSSAAAADTGAATKLDVAGGSTATAASAAPAADSSSPEAAGLGHSIGAGSGDRKS